MKKQRGYGELLFGVLLLVGIVGFSMAIVFPLSYSSCHSRWERSGMAGVSWGPIQGCLVKMPDGRWLPADRIREMDIPKTPSQDTPSR